MRGQGNIKKYRGLRVNYSLSLSDFSQTLFSQHFLEELISNSIKIQTVVVEWPKTDRQTEMTMSIVFSVLQKRLLVPE
jgi:hypothetical protein